MKRLLAWIPSINILKMLIIFLDNKKSARESQTDFFQTKIISFLLSFLLVSLLLFLLSFLLARVSPLSSA